MVFADQEFKFCFVFMISDINASIQTHRMDNQMSSKAHACDVRKYAICTKKIFVARY